MGSVFQSKFKGTFDGFETDCMKRFPLLIALVFSASLMAQKPLRLLIGTYTNACQSDGIYVYEFDPATAQTRLLSSTKSVENPSYLTVSDDHKKVYCVNEGGSGHRASAFSFNSRRGKLDFLNTVDTQGEDPCFILYDKGNVFTANYSGGSVSVFKTDDKGRLSPLVQKLQHEGHSLTSRQKSPHVHQVQLSQDRRHLFATDLGTDRIYTYSYDPSAGEQVLTFRDTVPVKTASGPRHMALSQDGETAYLLQELDGTLTAYRLQNGKFSRMQESTIVEPGFSGQTGAADIHLSPDGLFLYATNRGDANTISVFRVQDYGRIALVETMASGGVGPRNFAISPDGKYLLVAHQQSNEMVVFSRNETTGKLTDTGKRISLCSPVCLVFASQD